jgi:ribosomal protein S27E
MEPVRFDDDGTHLALFLDEVWVKCPRCGKAATVLSPQPYWESIPRFACGSCALSVEGRGTRWFGPAQGRASARCSSCGDRLSKSFGVPAGSGTPAETKITCDGCRTLTRATVSWSYDTGGLPLDPGFGMDLLLQTVCVGEVLWAYNARHLNFLADYVRATLRERSANHNSTLASRLPVWMKAAGNRRAVMRSIHHLRAELPA